MWKTSFSGLMVVEYIEKTLAEWALGFMYHTLKGNFGKAVVKMTMKWNLIHQQKWVVIKKPHV